MRTVRARYHAAHDPWPSVRVRDIQPNTKAQYGDRLDFVAQIPTGGTTKVGGNIVRPNFRVYLQDWNNAIGGDPRTDDESKARRLKFWITFDPRTVVITPKAAVAKSPATKRKRKNSKSVFDLVGEFNAKFGLPVANGGEPKLPDEKTFLYRLNHQFEELIEMVRAYYAEDILAYMDSLSDQEYVILGHGHFANLPLDASFHEVHAANMRKERVKSARDSKRGDARDVCKPEGWVGPNLEDVLKAHRKKK